MKKLLPVLATVAIIFGLYQISPYHQQEGEMVQLIQPEISPLRDMVLLQGRVTDPNPVRLYTDGPAVVQEILVKPGQRVREGQALIRLYQTGAEEPSRETAMTAMRQLQQAVENGDLAAAEALLSRLEIPSNTQSSGSECQKAYQLYSPVNGMVMDISAVEGENVGSLFPCISLCDPDHLVIEAEATEDTIGLLREDQVCEITIPAFHDQFLAGKVETVMPYARQTGLLSGSASAKTNLQITVSDSSDLRPGYRAEVKVVTSYKDAALLIPYEAVLQDDTGQEYVKVLEDSIVVRRDIETGSELDDRVEVQEGLTGKDLLLLSPNTVQEGAVVRYESVGTHPSGT